jgi:hypothetical protein
MKPITLILWISVRRFITDRYTYRTEPNALPELVALGLIVLSAFWPIVVLARTMAATLK